MKTSTVIIVLGLGAAGVYLYRRGRETHQAIAQEGDLQSTVRAGVLSAYDQIKTTVATAIAPTPAPATQTVGTAGTSRTTGLPPLAQTVPTHDTYRLTQLSSPRTVMTTADLTAQGIAV